MGLKMNEIFLRLQCRRVIETRVTHRSSRNGTAFYRLLLCQYFLTVTSTFRVPILLRVRLALASPLYLLKRLHLRYLPQ